MTSPTTIPDWNSFGGDSINALENPQAAMAATQSVLKESRDIPKPAITAPASRFIDLEHGILRDGTWHTRAEVRELTGEDEEAIEAAGGEDLRAFETALVRGVVRIGDLEMTRALAGELLMGEREALLLAVRRATFGDFVEYRSLPCGECGELTDLNYHLDDLPVRKMENPRQEQHRVKLTAGAVAVVRIPTGADQAHAMGLKNATAAKVNSEMLTRCVLSVTRADGHEESTYGLARRLSMADRRTLVRWLVDAQPGPQYDKAVWTHETCGQEVPLPLSLGILFRGF